MVKVAVLDDWQDVARGSADWSPLMKIAEVVFFADAFKDEADAALKLADFWIVLSMRERTKFPKSLIERLPNLRMLGITGERNLSLDVEACTERGIVVCHTTSSGRARAATAELALGLMLTAGRGIAMADANMREGKFQRGLPVGMSFAGKTIGVLGLGKLGSCMARYCAALGMNVIAWSPNLTEDLAKAGGAELVGKDELFSRADVVSVHVVLSERSRGLVGAREIGLMKRGAILVNTSRGPIVDEGALLEAVNEGRIVAGLDVFDVEPLPMGHPLRSARNTVLTPHIGYGVRETWADFYGQSVENAVAFLEGRAVRVLGSSKPEVWRPGIKS